MVSRSYTYICWRRYIKIVKPTNCGDITIKYGEIVGRVYDYPPRPFVNQSV